jgi:O-antigen/teichoic acid export membrane protein
MILAGIISFYVTFGDRYFLKLYGTLTDVGLYALGYKFGFLLTFIGIGPFFSIWDSERYNILKKPDAKIIFQEVFVSFTVIMLVIAIGISVFARNVLTIMANPEFWGAAKIVPIVILAYFFQGLTSYCNMGILIQKKTFIITKSIMLSAALITMLYFVLIPNFGALGAAWATALTFAFRFLYIYSRAMKLYNMELPWKKLYLLLPPSILVVLIGMVGPDKIIWSIPLNILIFISFLFLLTLLPVLSKKQRYILRGLLLRPWKFPYEICVFTKSR